MKIPQTKTKDELDRHLREAWDKGIKSGLQPYRDIEQIIDIAKATITPHHHHGDKYQNQ